MIGSRRGLVKLPAHGVAVPGRRATEAGRAAANGQSRSLQVVKSEMKIKFKKQKLKSLKFIELQCN
jgi:hypothetical protein